MEVQAGGWRICNEGVVRQGRAARACGTGVRQRRAAEACGKSVRESGRKARAAQARDEVVGLAHGFFGRSCRTTSPHDLTARPHRTPLPLAVPAS
jgi:hypothetical protein